MKLLAGLYGVGPEDRENLLTLVHEANQPEWYVALARHVPNWFRQYLGYEGSATEILAYSVELIDGCMQTEAYSRAIAQANQPDASDRDLDAYVAVRRGPANPTARQPPTGPAHHPERSRATQGGRRP